MPLETSHVGPVAIVRLSADALAVDYELNLHIVDPIDVALSGNGKMLLVRRRLSKADPWEAAPLEDFAVDPPLKIVKDYDPSRIAKYPSSDKEHQDLLRHYGFI